MEYIKRRDGNLSILFFFLCVMCGFLINRQTVEQPNNGPTFKRSIQS